MNSVHRYEFDANDETKGTMITFPYPYQNGRLHLGHAFSSMRTDMAARFMRLTGKHVLFPFAFHGTGMPIVACAQKIKEEYERKDLVDKPGSQTSILRSMGVPKEEIQKFSDPKYWLKYFPKMNTEDIKKFNLSIDYRRSFVTTDINPHYDSFVRWQFHHLMKKGFLKFGKKYVIYSPKDGQPCADHDRSTGEGVSPKLYYLVKFHLKENIYLLTATLRPETLNGVTNLWINPEAEYISFEYENKVFIARRETWRNLCYQTGKNLLLQDTFTGSYFEDFEVKHPTQDRKVKVYPLKEVSGEIGTGIVMSVPAHAIFDAYYYSKLISKDDPPSVISIEGDNLYAWNQVTKKKFKLKNMTQLTSDTYFKTHHLGVMTVEDYKDETVANIQEKVIDDFKIKDIIFDYYEPESKVISRSGDTCVVCNTDQWFITYNNETIKEKVYNHIDKMELKEEVKKSMRDFVDRDIEWPVSRTTGMGTYLPGSDKFLIDSLSDSTIYMAYYTVAHIVKKYPVDYFKNNVWDYIFFKHSIKPYSDDSAFMTDLDIMKKEFNYWYPITRVSGKDLVGNHLVMSLFNHAIIWDNEPDKWPRRFSINGYLTIDGEKMSKSKGNFFTLNETIDKYGLSETRFALASSANDSMDDANFDTTMAAKMKEIFNKDIQMIENIGQIEETGEMDYADQVFVSKVIIAKQKAIEEFNKFNFRDALFYGYHQMKDAYSTYKKINREKINKNVKKLFVESFFSLLSPIVPDFVEKMINVYEKYNKVEIGMKDTPMSIFKNAILIDNLLTYIAWKTNGEYQKSKDKTNYKPTITFYKTISENEKNAVKLIEKYKTAKDFSKGKKELISKIGYFGLSKKQIPNYMNILILAHKDFELCGSGWYETFIDISKYDNFEMMIKKNIDKYMNGKYEYELKFEEKGEEFAYTAFYPRID